MDKLPVLDVKMEKAMSHDVFGHVYIPEYQRMIDSDSECRIQGMIEEQQRRIESGMSVIIPGVIHLARTSNQEKWDVIDGQHRMHVLKALPNTEIYMQLWTLPTVQDIRTLMKLLNATKPIQSYELYSDKSVKHIYDVFRMYMEDTYGGCLSTSLAPKRPNIHLNRLIERMESEHIISKYMITTPLQLIQYIETQNKRLKALLLNSLDPATRTMIEKCKKHQFYLGMDPYEHYLLEPIVVEPFPSELPVFQKKRRPIPSKVRADVWKKCCGTEKKIGACYVCEQMIEDSTFECGHIRSVKDGGDDSIHNLVAICRQCNASMSTMNLEEYKQMYYTKKEYPSS
jgi:hypothetical protein